MFFRKTGGVVSGEERGRYEDLVCSVQLLATLCSESRQRVVGNICSSSMIVVLDNIYEVQTLNQSLDRYLMRLFIRNVYVGTSIFVPYQRNTNVMGKHERLSCAVCLPK